MIDPTKNEIAAMEYASKMAGEVIEEHGQTDMAQMTVNQWMTLIEVIVTGYTDELRRLSK